MRNYLDTIEQLVAEINEIEAEAEERIAPLRQVLEILRKENQACCVCKGTGERRFTDAAGSRDSETCPHCAGSGIQLI